MTGTIITGVHLTGVTLSNPTTQNPATIAASGRVSNITSGGGPHAALYGLTGTAWTISNFGTVSGLGLGTNGIFLPSGGEVTNGSSIATKALIECTGDGVLVTSAVGTVANFGTIEGAGLGVDLVDGGSFTNGSNVSTDALIKGGFGVVVIFAAATIANFGTIEATSTSGVGIELGAGGEVTNGSSVATKALIEGGYGVHLFAPGTIANFGTIEATDAKASFFPSAIWLSDGGVVTNGSTAARGAVISSAGDGAISIGGTAGGSGTVTNFGTIATSGTTPVALAPAIYLGGGGTITNYGLVKGAVPSTGGPQGVITTHNALATIRNLGTVLSTNGNNGINLDHGGTIINGSTSDKTALISGLSSGIVGGNSPHTGAAYGVGAAGTIVNYGTIKSTGNGSVISLISGGVVTNHGIIEGTGTGNPGNTGILLAGSAVKVTNSGTIISAGEDGSGVDLHSNGYVSNTGLISAYHIGIYANTTTSTGRVVNLGTIESTQKATPITSAGDGILMEKGGDVTNGSTTDLTATISAVDGIAVSMHGNGTLANFGTVTATNAAHSTVNLIAGGQIFNGDAKHTTALISGLGVVVNMTGVAGTVTNFGTIDNTGTINPAIYLGAGGRVTNFGTITGATGIAVAAGDTTATTVTNAGRIVGTGGMAVAFGGANDVLIVDAGAVFTGAVNGGGGGDRVVQGFAGTLAVAGFSGFERITLFNGGIDKLTLQTANFTGVTGATITVIDGRKGSTVSAAGVAAADRIVVHAGIGADFLTGGRGNDVFYTGGDTTMTGGKGANEFVFTAPGGNTIKDFHVSATNELVFSNAGFNLGLTGGTTTPMELTAAEAATLFVANTTGNFGNTSQRLAYDKTTGQLFASSDGKGSAAHLVATLTDHAAIAAGQLFFIA